MESHWRAQRSCLEFGLLDVLPLRSPLTSSGELISEFCCSVTKCCYWYGNITFKKKKKVSLADPNALSGLLLADPLNSRIIWSVWILLPVLTEAANPHSGVHGGRLQNHQLMQLHQDKFIWSVCVCVCLSFCVCDIPGAAKSNKQQRKRGGKKVWWMLKFPPQINITSGCGW